MNFKATIELLIKTSLLQRKTLIPNEADAFPDLTDRAIFDIPLAHLIEVPKESKFGDYAFPGFALSKLLKIAPQKAAELLKSLIQKLLEVPETQSSLKVFFKYEVVGPYLNFFVETGALARVLTEEIQNGTFLAERPTTGEKIMVEYSQPNTHKAFHVGHTRCASLGDTLGRILKWSGNDVIYSNYMGDEGTHVAKCLWYLKTRYKGSFPDKHRGEFLGVLYAKAVEEFDLSLHTKVPILNVSAAQVLSIDPHPKNDKLSVVKVITQDGEKQVVTACKGFSVDDKVAYAAIGSKIGGRSVQEIEKEGVKSTGMLCSPRELELSDDNESIYVLSSDVSIGEALINTFQYNKEESKRDLVQEYKHKESEVTAVLKNLEENEPETKKLWETTKAMCMEEFYENYRWLDCQFDHYFFESQFGESSKQLVKEFFQKGVFVESQGAIGADLQPWDLGFCILTKRDGNATYASRDLSLANKKFKDFNITTSIHVVDVRQTQHFKQVFKCLEIMGFQQAKNCVHVSYEMVVTPDGAMSSRKGNVILFSTLQEQLLKRIKEEYLFKYENEWSASEIEDTAYKIAKATIRYGMLNQDNNSLVVFDLKEWTSRTGNTGPYILYAYARMMSILREAAKHKRVAFEKEAHIDADAFSKLSDETEVDLLLFMNTYHEVLERIAKRYSPHILCSFVFDLAKKFHRMYHQCPVLQAHDETLVLLRLRLVRSLSQVLKHALSLLGIETVERM
jgi:arginyl-tRNA synthetase